MLTLKQTRKTKKGAALQPSNYDLYLNGGVTGGKQVSSRLLLQALASGCDNGKAGEEEFKNKAKSVSNKTEQRFSLPQQENRIVDEFTLEQTNGAFRIKEDSFYIRNEYLPDDDNAPDRVHKIVESYCSAINQYFDDKVELANSEEDYVSELNMYWTVEESDNGWELLRINPDGSTEVETNQMLNKEHVIQTLFVYLVDLTKCRQATGQRVMDLVSDIKRGNLKGLKIGRNDKDRIVPLNIGEFDEETQEVINEVINYFQV